MWSTQTKKRFRNTQPTPQNRTMKTMIRQGLIALFSLAAFASADEATKINVVVKSGVAIGQPPSGGSVNTWRSKITPADNAVPEKITRLHTALQIRFESTDGTPVNVTNVKFQRFEYTLIQNGVIVWKDVPIGSYHPAPQGSPDYWAFNLAGNDVTPASGYVSGYLGDNSGTTIPLMSTFQLLDQTISLGTPDRPLLTASGQYYSLVYNITLASYTYNGVTYTDKVLTPVETEVLVRMTDGLPEYTAPTDPSKQVPCLVELQVSGNLVNWFPAPNVVIPSPRPTLDRNIMAMVPETTEIPGVPKKGTRFARYVQEPVMSP